jgi:choice-of-anchor B domain-containing protein
MIKNILFTISGILIYLNVNAQLVPCVNGFAGNYPCDKVDLVAHMPLSTIGAAPGINGNDIWGWTDEASGREFVIMGLVSGTSFIEITDPLNPEYLGILPPHSANSSWRDMKTYNNYAFIVSEAGGHGIQVFDLTRLLNVVNGPVTFTEDAHHASLGGSAHNIVGAIESGHMVLVGSGYSSCGKGFDFYDVSDPLDIRYKSCYGASASTYTHDAVCFIYKGPDTDHVGREICIGSNGNRGGTSRQVIIDATDKQSIQTISATSYPLQRYTHQSWITDDHKYLIFNDELDELDFSSISNTRTHMMDIRDLDTPVYMGYYEHDTPVIDHNCHVKGQYVYESNYESGLRILDLTQVADSILTLVGHFDTYIANSNSRHFNGAWGNYPFFESGIIAISDINGGLFLLKPNLPHFILDVSENANEACPGEDLVFNIDLKSLHGYSDDVDIVLQGLPAGASATLAATTLSTGGSTTLTISNTTGLSGSYAMLLVANGATSSQHHEKAIYIDVRQIPATESLDGLTLAVDQKIIASQSINLKNIMIANNVDVKVFSPILNVMDNLEVLGTGRLIWKQQDLCAPH